MKSQEKRSADERSFRPARPPARAAAGVAAAVAVVSFAFLVFGPLSDQRAFALAGVHDAGSSGYAGSRGREAQAVRSGQAGSAPTARVEARAARRGFEMALQVVVPTP